MLLPCTLSLFLIFLLLISYAFFCPISCFSNSLHLLDHLNIYMNIKLHTSLDNSAICIRFPTPAFCLFFTWLALSPNFFSQNLPLFATNQLKPVRFSFSIFTDCFFVTPSHFKCYSSSLVQSCLTAYLL